MREADALTTGPLRRGVGRGTSHVVFGRMIAGARRRRHRRAGGRRRTRRRRCSARPASVGCSGRWRAARASEPGGEASTSRAAARACSTFLSLFDASSTTSSPIVPRPDPRAQVRRAIADGASSAAMARLVRRFARPVADRGIAAGRERPGGLRQPRQQLSSFCGARCSVSAAANQPEPEIFAAPRPRRAAPRGGSSTLDNASRIDPGDTDRSISTAGFPRGSGGSRRSRTWPGRSRSIPVRRGLVRPGRARRRARRVDGAAAPAKAVAHFAPGYPDAVFDLA